MIGSLFFISPMCLWRYIPAPIVSGVPRIRQSELIPLLSIDIMLPHLSVQIRPLDPQLLGGISDFPVIGLQSLEDEFAFKFVSCFFQRQERHG